MPASHHPLAHQRLDGSEMTLRAAALHHQLSARRTVREFSDAPVPRAVVEAIVRTAASSPSGAHKQPWHFCVVEDPAIKQRIREAAEREEFDNYHGRMSDAWLADLEPFGTDWHKPFLTTAPYLIVVFKKPYDLHESGQRHKNYYVNESVGIACGFLIAAIHMAGLVTVTPTPSPMNFLQEVLGRPENERAYLLLPVGLPAEGATVPAIERKELAEVMTWY